MKRCPRCQTEPMKVVREGVERRQAHEYLVYWYRCPVCQEVGFSYRLLRDVPVLTPDPVSDLVTSR